MSLELVELKPLLPTAIFDLRYATANNVAGKVLYEDAIARLQPTAAEQLVNAAKFFGDYAMRLVIWDAHRPEEVQRIISEIAGDPEHYALDPKVSKHPKGLAVDLTLAYKDGELLDMGTDFDDFSPAAHLDADDLTETQYANRDFLAKGMAEAGFSQWPFEWWHFDFTGGDDGPSV